MTASRRKGPRTFCLAPRELSPRSNPLTRQPSPQDDSFVQTPLRRPEIISQATRRTSQGGDDCWHRTAVGCSRPPVQRIVLARQAAPKKMKSTSGTAVLLEIQGSPMATHVSRGTLFLCSPARKEASLSVPAADDAARIATTSSRSAWASFRSLNARTRVSGEKGSFRSMLR